MKISGREKILLLAAVYLLIVSCGFKFAYMPANTELCKLQDENKNFRQQMQDSEELEQEKTKQISTLHKDMKLYNLLDAKVPRDKQFVEMIDYLGTLAEDKSVRLLSIAYKGQDSTNAEGDAAVKKDTTATSSKLKGVSTMTFTVSCTGSYYKLLAYLQSLENSPRIISVETVSLTITQNKQESSNSGTASSGSGSSISTDSSSGSYSSNSSSTNTVENLNPPPEVPTSKGKRVQMEKSTTGSTTSGSNGTSATNTEKQTTTNPAEPERYKYDPNKLQMNLQITTYYDTTSPAIDSER